jgi:multiple sugar transport system permease protein
MASETLPSSAPVRQGISGIAGRLKPGKRARELIPIYLFILPGTLVFLTWTIYPLIDAFVMSFYHWNLLEKSAFIGLDNYRRALNDPIFWQALRNVLMYTVIGVPGQMILGLAVALLLDQSIRFRAFFRTLFYLPVVTSWVVVSFLFTYLYNGQAGALNYVLHDILHIIPNYVFWLGDPNTALPAIAGLNIWKGIGWTAVIYLAGLQAIPVELHDAARVDGAGPWQRFTHVTLPLLSPTVTFLMVMLVIGAMNTFIQVFIMTDGGPLNSTETVLTYMYHNAFGSLDLGYGAAISYLFTMLMFVVSLIQIRVLRRRYEY